MHTFLLYLAKTVIFCCHITQTLFTNPTLCIQQLHPKVIPRFYLIQMSVFRTPHYVNVFTIIKTKFPVFFGQKLSSRIFALSSVGLIPPQTLNGHTHAHVTPGHVTIASPNEWRPVHHIYE